MTGFHTLLTEDGNFTYPFDVDAECTDVHTLNSSLQCMFAMTALDCVQIIEYLDYNYYVFCNFGLKQVIPSTITLVLWLLMLFIGLGVTSNYFLCPALFTISNHLGLSQNVAGVTLLAFGNAAPDIFSSVAGLQKASAELIIASLLGGGVFVTSVVAGLVFLTKAFSLMVRPFLRDVTFYLIAIGWTFALFYTERSYLYHGIGFVSLYFVYIVVVIGSRFVYVNTQKKKDVKKENEEKKSANETEKKAEKDTQKNADTSLKIDENGYHDDDGTTAVVLKAFYFGGFEWLDGGGRRLSRCHMFQDGRRLSMKPNIPSNINIYSIENNGSGNFGSSQSIQSKGMSSTEKLSPIEEEDRGELWDFMVKVSPINIKKWSRLQWWKKILALGKSPAIFILRVTVPVLDTSEEDLSWNRYLICLQCITGPIFISLVSGHAFYMIGGVFPIFILLFSVSACFSILVYCTSQRDTPPTYHWLFAYLGFAVSVTWIYCFANEIVALLQVIGIIFQLSDAILGLTVLAWGNSLSDFVSNLAVARKDYPRMAISACFGGPLLALLLGLGMPCILEIVKGRVPSRYPLIFSAQFAFLFATIATTLITTATLMCLWKFETKRLYGLFPILLYITFVLASVLEELGIFSLPM